MGVYRIKLKRPIENPNGDKSTLRPGEHNFNDIQISHWITKGLIASGDIIVLNSAPVVSTPAPLVQRRVLDTSEMLKASKSAEKVVTTPISTAGIDKSFGVVEVNPKPEEPIVEVKEVPEPIKVVEVDVSKPEEPKPFVEDVKEAPEPVKAVVQEEQNANQATPKRFSRTKRVKV